MDYGATEDIAFTPHDVPRSLWIKSLKDAHLGKVSGRPGAKGSLRRRMGDLLNQLRAHGIDVA